MGSWANTKQRVQAAVGHIQGGRYGRVLDDLTQMHGEFDRLGGLYRCHEQMQPLDIADDGKHTPLPAPNAIENLPAKAQKALTAI